MQLQVYLHHVKKTQNLYTSVYIEFFSGELLQIENKIENSGVVPTIIVLHTKYNINDIELGRR